MSEPTPVPPEASATSLSKPTGWRAIPHTTENVLLALALGALILLPLIEATLRMFRTGMSASSEIIKHLTLVVGMLGAAIAARENRLLSLSSLTTFLKGRTRSFAVLFSHSVGAAVTAVLFFATIQFVKLDFGSDRMLAFGIPLWVVQLVLPIGFALVGIRLLWHAASSWKGRVTATALAIGLMTALLKAPLPPEKLVIPAMIVLVVAIIFGAPVFTALGGIALILLWGSGEVISSVAVKHYSLVTNEALPAIPLFTLAGYFLAEGGAAKRLVRVFQTVFGAIRGGPAIVTVLVCAFFTSFTGASGVTILALGGLLMPVLIAARYSERNALGLLTSAGSLGLLFPPCLPLILYSIIASTVASQMDFSMLTQLRPGSVSADLDPFAAQSQLANVTIEKMFLGGIGPGILLVALTAWWGIRKGSAPSESAIRFNGREAASSLWAAKWELMLPVVALVALFSGHATAIEAAALTAMYAFVVEVIVYRDLHPTRDVPRVMAECGLLVGGVLLILGVAMGLTHYLIMEEVPTRGVEWVTKSIQSPWAFLLMLNLFLIVVGCLMDIYSAIVVIVPLIVPMGVAFGIDPVHLGIIFLANLELGYLTPPVGMNLFLASYRFGKPMSEVTRAVLPMLGVMLIGVLLITYVPPLTTFLPSLLK